MKHQKLFSVLCLIFVVLLLTACEGASAPLYLCKNDNGESEVLVEECEVVGVGYSQALLYPQANHVDFEYTLGGDIQGTSYTFNLWFASGDNTTFDVSIILQQAGAETVLASTSFIVPSSTFEPYVETVSGLDPTTENGDILILRILPASGAEGAVIYSSSDKDQASFVKIPSIE